MQHELTPAEPPASRSSSPRDAVLKLQDRIAAAFGIRPKYREITITAALERGKLSAGYWLQLMLAMGIATLGLALGSTAVVIGAMLVSPLMSPIVELGMGLAVGSPFLVIRSFSRTTTSILAVIAGAALITVGLPFHEVTAEIAARTSPTALDLVIASFCAIAAAYTTARPGSDTTATAAGTAIGIALVPPLCVIGYGIGTRSRSIAGGASLLFTANFCAIVLFAVLCFLLLGFNSVSIGELERAELDRHEHGTIRRIARALQVVFASKYAAVFRVLMPLVLLAAVYFPLRQALAEVSWQVRVRSAVSQLVDSIPSGAVRSSISVDRHTVTVRVVTLGRAEDAARIEQSLREQIAAIAGVVPSVAVIAVPDATALEAIAATAKVPSVPMEVVRKEPDVPLLSTRLHDALSKTWPAEAGSLIKWRVELAKEGLMVLEVLHLGPPLGAAAISLLGAALSREAEIPIQVREIAIPTDPVVAEAPAGMQWLPKALHALGRIEPLEGFSLCVEVPAPPEKNKPIREKKPDNDAATVVQVLRSLDAFASGRLSIREASQWKAVVSSGPCEGPQPDPPKAPPEGTAPAAAKKP